MDGVEPSSYKELIISAYHTFIQLFTIDKYIVSNSPLLLLNLDGSIVKDNYQKHFLFFTFYLKSHDVYGIG